MTQLYFVQSVHHTFDTYYNTSAWYRVQASSIEQLLYRDFDETTALTQMQTTLFATWILSPPHAPIYRGFIQVKAGQITAIGKQTNLAATIQPDVTTEFITPGLINTHTHLDLTDTAPIEKSEHESMSDWLFKVIEHRNASDSKLTATERTEQQCAAGVQHMLKTGVTTVNDIAQSNHSCQAIIDSGLRGVVSAEFFHPGWKELNLSHVLSTYETEFSPYKDVSSRLQLGLSPHSLYNVSPKAWQFMVRETQPTLIHTHLAECADERNWLLGQQPNGINAIHQAFLKNTFTPQPHSGHHPPPTTSTHSPEWRYIKEQGLLTDDTTPIVFAHGSLLTPTDLNELQQHEHLHLAHCPISNEFLHHHTLQLKGPYRTESKIRSISLGTDSSLSHPTLDIRDDARRAYKLHDLGPADVLQQLTFNGASALQLNEKTGQLRTGYAADLVCWQQDPSPNKALPDKDSTQAYTQWLSPHTHVQQVMIDGCWRYIKGII
jgi:cytosine/adenosine deaminase-related metal-dependent hydrolase